jgi:hypothetical protein
MTAVNLERKLVDAFTSGKLDQSGEAALAGQVAQLLPMHWMLPNSAAAALSKLTKHLGGPAALEAWLDSHPGRPRLGWRGRTVSSGCSTSSATVARS